jgi:hypothetical protein
MSQPAKAAAASPQHHTYRKHMQQVFIATKTPLHNYKPQIESTMTLFTTINTMGTCIKEFPMAPTKM